MYSNTWYFDHFFSNTRLSATTFSTRTPPPEKKIADYDMIVVQILYAAPIGSKVLSYGNKPNLMLRPKRSTYCN